MQIDSLFEDRIYVENLSFFPMTFGNIELKKHEPYITTPVRIRVEDTLFATAQENVMNSHGRIPFISCCG